MMDLTPQDEAFVQELARRVRPAMGVVVKTKRGELVLTQADKTRLELLARQVGMSDPANLVNVYLT